MKIGVIGSGQVGQALAKGLASEGHSVRIGSRESGKLAEFSAANKIAQGRFADVAADAEVVLLAVKGDAAESVTRELAPQLRGKVVLDTTNPISGAPCCVASPRPGLVARSLSRHGG